MQDTGIFQNYTIQSLLDKLDIIECFENLGYDLRVGEVLTKQIYEALGISPPAYLGVVGNPGSISQAHPTILEELFYVSVSLAKGRGITSFRKHSSLIRRLSL